MINMGEVDERKHLLGLVYLVTKLELEDHISDYCLMLQYQDQKDEGAKDLYAVVFDD